MTPYSRPKLSDLYTLSKSKLLEYHTLHSDTYLYSPYIAVPPPPRGFTLGARDFSTAVSGFCQVSIEKPLVTSVIKVGRWNHRRPGL